MRTLIRCDAVRPGEPILLSLSEIRDLNGTMIDEGSVGLFEEYSLTLAAAGHYDTVVAARVEKHRCRYGSS